jgi:hypothetical protein
MYKGIDPNGHTNDGMQKTDQEMPGEQSGIAEELSEQEGRLSYRQTAGSWNILDTLAFVIICQQPEHSMMF